MLISISACSGEIYLRDGVTDGDTFYLSPRALVDPDPALQSWVSYSLSRSACQLQLGGDNPARNRSHACEVTARRHLVETWAGNRSADHRSADHPAHDAYLDTLATVHRAGYLDEYVFRFLAPENGSVPDGLDLAAFKRWQRVNLAGHKPETRITGSWNYAHVVRPGTGRE